MFGNILILVASLLTLALGAEFLVQGASRIARKLGVSTFFIGLTVVAFGTSAPELAASATASWDGHTTIAIGNVVGSNIINIGVVLGLTALIMPIPVARPSARFTFPVVD